jgi:hypothetical protein
MVRRADSSYDADSASPSPNPAARVRAERLRAEKTQGKARAGDEGMSPKGAKHARANDAGGAVPKDEDGRTTRRRIWMRCVGSRKETGSKGGEVKTRRAKARRRHRNA